MRKLSAAVMESFKNEMMEPSSPPQGPPQGNEEKMTEQDKEEESEELADYKRALLVLYGIPIEKQANSSLLMSGSRPLTLVKRVMKGVMPPPGNAGARITGRAPAPKTAVGSKPINVKSPSFKNLKAPKVPTPKPASVKPGGEILPGKNAVT